MIVEVVMDLSLPTLLSNIIDIGISNQDYQYVISTEIKILIFLFIGLIGGAKCSMSFLN